MVGEASYSLSGFGIYTLEILKRLVATNKYDIAEFASYGIINDPRDSIINWPIYVNAVRDDDPRAGEYRAEVVNQFGKWRFERVCLEFKPDICINVRDPWMLEWEKDSAYRRFFHQIWMPTCDSRPQKEEWIDSFCQADSVFTWSDFGTQVLREQSNDKIKLVTEAPAGTNLEIFKPVYDKAKHRAGMGLPSDINLIGTVMRNQRRKLYPDLFYAFKLFLEKCHERGLHDLAKKTYLYVHTSYPDAGWMIPELLRENNISHKVFFSYICQQCKYVFSSFFQDALGICPRCRANAVLPNVTTGATPEKLADIYNLFDVYVQYAICEGLGMPQIEAASCGVPLMSIDYSAMSDVVRRAGGVPLKLLTNMPHATFLELETGAYRALPDNDNTAEEFIKFFTLPLAKRFEMAKSSRHACETYYNYDHIAKKWEAHLDSIQLTGYQGRWSDTPPIIYNVPTKIPDNLSNEAFVGWIFNEVLRQPHLRYTYTGLRLGAELNIGASFVGGIHPINRDMIFNYYRNLATHIIRWEQVRTNLLPVPNEDYIDYCNIKKKALALQPGDKIP